MNEFKKPQSPIEYKGDYIYPITYHDQIIMPDGVSRFDGGVIVDYTDATIGEPAWINADTLGGIPADQYALKGEAGSGGSSLPSGGTAGQVLTKTSNSAEWANITWNNVTNKPTQFNPTIHTHTTGEISDSSVETWTFTLDNGSTVTKKVMIVD